jgi:DNA polymerase-3 subunit beta
MNFLLTCQEDHLSVLASDGNVSCQVVSPMKDSKGNECILNLEPGSVQTNARMLLEIISKCSGDVVTLYLADTNYLNVSDNESDFNLVTKAGEEYPDVNLTIPEGQKGLPVALKDLKKLYETTSFAVSTKGPKELFFGINVRAHDGKLFFTSTDNYRMAENSVTAPRQDLDFSFTCPTKPLSMLTNLGTDGDCTIYFDEQSALFVSGGVTIATRLLRGDFPTADKLIPVSFPYQIQVDTKVFLDAADKVKIISTNEEPRVRLVINKEAGVTMNVQSSTYGNGTTPLKGAKVTMPTEENVFEIGFNVDFVVGAVKALQSSSFTFLFAGQTRPFMVKSDDPANIQIITPVRIATF